MVTPLKTKVVVVGNLVDEFNVEAPCLVHI
jgi:hypothetical protein